MAGIANADKLRIGSVDKMQGQGAAVVIFSLASSSQDYSGLACAFPVWSLSPGRSSRGKVDA